jgi:hypothetical protein
MRPSTIWEIEAATPEASRYGGEGERPLFGEFNSVRPKMIELNRDGVITFKDAQNATPFAVSEHDAKITQNASSFRGMRIQGESAGEYWSATDDWPTGGGHRIADLQDSPFIRLGHGVTDTSQLVEMTLNATASDVLVTGTYGQGSYDVACNVNKAFHLRKPLDAALQPPVTVVFVWGHNPYPIPSETLSALERIKNLPDNWDGDGAPRIAEGTVAKAERLIREAFLASPNRLRPPSVAPAFGGMIVAEWAGPRGRELILDIPAGDDPPGFLLIEISPEGEELETDDQVGHAWSIQDLITRLIRD